MQMISKFSPPSMLWVAHVNESKFYEFLESYEAQVDMLVCMFSKGLFFVQRTY